MLSKFRPKLVILLIFILFLVIKCEGSGSGRYGEIELGGYPGEIEEEEVEEEEIEEAPIYGSTITGGQKSPFKGAVSWLCWVTRMNVGVKQGSH
ncbi:unnamed protein product [Meloidogyne enterolobii]|uniref:Uncharacterized protein n=1 Tax=Meloidogyne enterolobii TaxID=390850 RepID=A0ACB0ZXB0_MELEN